MSERPIDTSGSANPANPKTYNGWTVLPCPVPLPPWPQQRYFLTDRPGDQNEFEMTMYEDFVDAYCHEHAYARAESLFGRSWGTVSRVEWITREGKHRVSEIRKALRLQPDGTWNEVDEPQREAMPEWRDAVLNNDEAAILRLMKREVAEAAEWMNPSAESLEELARKQVLLRKERAREQKAREKAEDDKAGGAA